MRMRPVLLAAVCLLSFNYAALAQSDRGTITGTVSDPAGAMIPNASIEAKNTATAAVYQVASTATGNYTLALLPAGLYQLSVSVPGFKQFVRSGITVLVAQTLRIDVSLEVGTLAETVTVVADAPLLKTESGELSHNVSTDRLDSLPIMFAGAGMRNPFQSSAMLNPGTGLSAGNIMRVNGQPGNTLSTRIEGQDSTNTAWSTAYSMSMPGVDSIEEVAIQTSNFAAEFGQAGGGVFNMTMKSGTNQFHGSGFEYLVNEAFNAATPFVNTKPRQRRHDFGFTVGGPAVVPRVYDGRDKTFFFFSFEQNRQKTVINNIFRTVPTLAFRQGDFRSLLTGRRLGTDIEGRPILEGTIYDPATARIVNGQIVTDPFPNNTIPQSRWDPVAARFQALIPEPTNSLPTNNYLPTYPNRPVTSIWSIKVDQMLGAKIKMAGYLSETNIYVPFPDGFAPPITTERDLTQRTYTTRLRLDYTVTPTTMLHFGAGLLHFVFDDPVPNINYDSFKELGLPGTYTTRPPTFYGLGTVTGGLGSASGQGNSAGPVAQQQQWQIKPTSNASVTWAKGNHTYKAGAELRIESYPSSTLTPANGWFWFNAAQTGLPYLNTTSPGGGTIGFPYASFLLGAVNNGEIGQASRFHLGKNAWGLYVQDSWKVTRRLTLDYGMRWDYQTYLKEQYGRIPGFGPTALNPKAGGLPGAVIFEGYGPGHCNCDFANNYPYAIGPRLGAAYQIASKTVLRAGWGISYGQTANLEMWSLRFGSDVRYGTPVFGTPAHYLKDGPLVKPVWPNYDPGQAPINFGDPFMTGFDHNAGRPPRIMMWSLGIQRQLSTNLSVEASYVGNRGVWWNSDAVLTDPNRLTPQILAKAGLDITKQADRDLLLKPISSPDAVARGFKPPFPGFPSRATVSQSLRPFPQFGGIFYLWAPLGNTWYDSLQLKVTKRYSHGLDFTAAFTWQKEFSIGAETQDKAFAAVQPSVNNVLDRNSLKYISGQSIPVRLVLAGNYTVPRLNLNRALSWAIRDWTFGAVLQYASGLPIHVPYAQNNLAPLLSLCAPMDVFGNCNGPGGAASHANRVPGEPLFTVDLNSKFDPNTTFVLNPKAWTDPAPGEFGTSAAYYSDYRFARRPIENMSLGRLFRFREAMSLHIRIELMNVFNRTYRSNPVATNAKQAQLKTAAGKPTSGFGYINTGAVASAARQGQLVVRFQF